MPKSEKVQLVSMQMHAVSRSESRDRQAAGLSSPSTLAKVDLSAKGGGRVRAFKTTWAPHGADAKR